MHHRIPFLVYGAAAPIWEVWQANAYNHPVQLSQLAADGAGLTAAYILNQAIMKRFGGDEELRKEVEELLNESKSESESDDEAST